MKQGHRSNTLQVALNFAQLGVAGRLVLIAAITKFGPNSPFYASHPEVKQVVDKVIAHGPTLTAVHNDAENKKKEASAAITTRDNEQTATDLDVNLLRALAVIVCKTQAELETLGLTRRVKLPPVALTPPVKVTAAPGKKAKGAIAAHALRIAGLSKYICAISPDPATPTSYQVLTGTAAKRTITGLESGKGYWIKYCTERGANRSDWSPPIFCIAS